MTAGGDGVPTIARHLNTMPAVLLEHPERLQSGHRIKKLS
jgi:hypothetical protein